jgi:carbonic anhydrase
LIADEMPVRSTRHPVPALPSGPPIENEGGFMPVIGSRQSPIRISTPCAMELARPDLLFRIGYEDREYHGVFIGAHPSHGNFKLDTPPYPEARFRDQVFELRRVHIHYQSEHLIDTEVPRDFEVHFVHAMYGKELDGPKLVVGILYHEGAGNRAGKGLEEFNEILKGRAKAGASLRKFGANDPVRDGRINPLNFFPRIPGGDDPDLSNWFYYEGSLTSEPYSEDVSWFVMRDESKIDPSNLRELEQYAEQEARPAHPLDRRLVVKSFA